MIDRLAMQILAGLALAVSACADGSAPAPPAAEQATAVLARFKQDLQSALRAGLEQGPEQAVSVCRERAPAIARSLSIDGVVVGRSSHRLRNPDNRAPAWVAPVIEAWLEDGAAREPQSVALDDGRAGYVEPIFMQPLCTTCHGRQIPAALAARIASEYPLDRATGFEVGDLRGVFWVELPAAADGNAVPEAE